MAETTLWSHTLDAGEISGNKFTWLETLDFATLMTADHWYFGSDDQPNNVVIDSTAAVIYWQNDDFELYASGSTCSVWVDTVPADYVGVAIKATIDAPDPLSLPYTPVTDRADGTARMTATDMNRITQNLAYVSTECDNAGISGTSAPAKTSWTTDDIITVAEWSDILASLHSCLAALSIAGGASDAMIYWNINAVESLTLQAFNRLNQIVLGTILNRYVNDSLYAGDPGLYSEGVAV